MWLLKCRYTVAFIMPSKYTKMTLPKPENANVQVRGWPHGKCECAYHAAPADCTLQTHASRICSVFCAGIVATGRLALTVLSDGRSRRCPHKLWQRCPGGEHPMQACAACWHSCSFHTWNACLSPGLVAVQWRMPMNSLWQPLLCTATPLLRTETGPCIPQVCDLSPATCFCNRGGPRPTDELVAAKRKELEAELLNLNLSLNLSSCNRGGPQPTDELVAAKRKELEAELQVNGIPVGPDAKTKLYQYYVRARPLIASHCLHCSAAAAVASRDMATSPGKLVTAATCGRFGLSSSVSICGTASMRHLARTAMRVSFALQPPFAPRWVRLQDVLIPVEYKEAPVVTPADKKGH